MALKKSIPTPYGVNAEYWLIAQMNVSKLQRNAHVDLLGFVSQEAREAYPDSQPIASRSFDWPPGEMLFGHDVNNFAIAYGQIKAWPTSDEFADAEDV